MNCELVVRHADAYVDGEVDPSTQIDFERHLAQCPACQEAVALVRACKRHVKETLTALAAPPGLKTRIRVALDGVDSMPRADAASATASSMEGGGREPVVRVVPVPARYAVPLAAAAALLLAVFGAADLRLGQATGVDQAAMPVFEDVVKLHSSPLPSDVAGNQPQQVSTFFRDKVRFPVRPVFDASQAELVGARLSNVRDHRAATLYYNVRGHRLTVVVFEDPTPDAVGPRTRYMGRDLYLMQVGGYTVPVVRRGPVTYAFTGDVDRETLLRLAVAARVQ